MILQPLKYATTILTSRISKRGKLSNIYTIKIIINSEGILLFLKRYCDLKSTLYYEGTNYRMNSQDILNSERTLFLKRDYDLENTLNSKGTKKEGEKWLKSASSR